MEYSAKIVQRYRADRFVVLEPVYKTAADVMVPDQFVRSDPLVLYRLIEWFVNDHFYHPIHNKPMVCILTIVDI